VHSDLNLVEEVGENGDSLAFYVHGPGLDRPLAMIRGGQTYFFHADDKGTIALLTDRAGKPAASYETDAFGQLLSPLPALANPFLYAGREYEPALGLYYNRARYYDPALGRFLSLDTMAPDRSNPATLNRYAYALNAPTRYSDPLGLQVAPATPSPLGLQVTAVPSLGDDVYQGAYIHFQGAGKADALTADFFSALSGVVAAVPKGNAYVPGPAAWEYVPPFLRLGGSMGIMGNRASPFKVSPTGAGGAGTSLGMSIFLTNLFHAQPTDLVLNSAIGAGSNYVGMRVTNWLSNQAMNSGARLIAAKVLDPKTLLLGTGLGAAQMGGASLVALLDPNSGSPKRAIETGFVVGVITGGFTVVPLALEGAVILWTPVGWAVGTSAVCTLAVCALSDIVSGSWKWTANSKPANGGNPILVLPPTANQGVNRALWGNVQHDVTSGKPLDAADLLVTNLDAQRSALDAADKPLRDFLSGLLSQAAALKAKIDASMPADASELADQCAHARQLADRINQITRDSVQLAQTINTLLDPKNMNAPDSTNKLQALGELNNLQPLLPDMQDAARQLEPIVSAVKTIGDKEQQLNSKELAAAIGQYEGLLTRIAETARSLDALSNAFFNAQFPMYVAMNRIGAKVGDADLPSFETRLRAIQAPNAALVLQKAANAFAKSGGEDVAHWRAAADQIKTPPAACGPFLTGDVLNAVNRAINNLNNLVSQAQTAYDNRAECDIAGEGWTVPKGAKLVYVKPTMKIRSDYMCNHTCKPGMSGCEFFGGGGWVIERTGITPAQKGLVKPFPWNYFTYTAPDDVGIDTFEILLKETNTTTHESCNVVVQYTVTVTAPVTIAIPAPVMVP
jgi:RHS repeat-associated protein